MALAGYTTERGFQVSLGTQTIASQVYYSVGSEAKEISFGEYELSCADSSLTLRTFGEIEY